jgi:glycosyltransferase involved in cell wall biosynthesis
MTPKITVITATTGRASLLNTIESVRKQSVPCYHIVVYDGVAPQIESSDNLHVISLPRRTGFAKYYGHRIYAGISMMVTTPFVSFLDDDNTLEPDWAEVMTMAMYASKMMPRCVTCRRSLIYKGNNIGEDKRESIGVNEYGYSLYDMNTYLFQTQALVTLIPFFFRQHIADRVLAEYLIKKQEVLHIEYPLVNYTLTDALYKSLKKVVL